jgi:hypothetical protein
LLPQISALDRGSVKSFVSAASEGEKFPPTVFAHMSKDSHTASAVKQQMVSLGAAGVQTAEVKVAARKIDDDFFVDEDVRPKDKNAITRELSKELVAMLRSKDLLDQQGYLKGDPRQTNWRDAFDRIVSATRLTHDASPISEMMNIAFAQHELMSAPVPSMMDFCIDPGTACPGSSPSSTVTGLSCGNKQQHAMLLQKSSVPYASAKHNGLRVEKARKHHRVPPI